MKAEQRERKSLSRARTGAMAPRLLRFFPVLGFAAILMGAGACGMPAGPSLNLDEHTLPTPSTVPATGGNPSQSSSLADTGKTNNSSQSSQTRSSTRGAPRRPGSLCAGQPEGTPCGPRGQCRGGECVPWRCGDGVVSPPEQCDDGNRSSNDGCSAQCRVEYCGDGIVQPPREACDIALDKVSKRCNEACILRAPCSNGILEPPEQCDDGNRRPHDGCSPLCTLERACGNGKVEAPEECDDGNQANGDGCSAQCVREYCGDGIIQGGEECDRGNQNNPADGCDVFCRLPMHRCGNGRVEPGEACDDGNYFNDDECPNDCQLALCGDGVREGLEGCDDGNQSNKDGCSAQCQHEFNCGDGRVEPGEQCDDRNRNNKDDCPNDCQFAVCGDGVVEGREACDSPEPLPSATCDAQCRWVEVCGDGRVTRSERCDDGNTEDGDGCSSKCELESCGNGVLDNQEECDDGNQTNNDGCSSCRHDWVNAACSACVNKNCPKLPQEGVPWKGNRWRCPIEDPTCRRLLDCYFETGCVTWRGTWTPTGAPRAAIDCFCGETPTGACMNDRIAPDPQGACRDTIYKVFGTRVAANIFIAFSSKRTSQGRANEFSTCMARYCHKDCYVNARRLECDTSKCEDSNPCTRAICDESQGCVNQAVKDGTSCEKGVCSAGQCVQCIQDTDCGVAQTCAAAPTCENQRCRPGAPVRCPQDEDPCTVALCEAKRGCQTQAARDGTLCGDNRMCSAGRCGSVDPSSAHKVVIPVLFQGGEDDFSGVMGPGHWKSLDYMVRTEFYNGAEVLRQVAFHCFDLSSVAGLIVKAQLRIQHPPSSYRSDKPSETVIYRNIEASQGCEKLRGAKDSPGLFLSFRRDAESGTYVEYGRLSVDTSINTNDSKKPPVVSEIELSPQALADLNRHSQQRVLWPVGAFLAKQGSKETLGRVFEKSSSKVSAPNELVLWIQTP